MINSVECLCETNILQPRKSASKMNIREEGLEMCFRLSFKIDIECCMRPGKTVAKFPRFIAGLFISFFLFLSLFSLSLCHW